MEVSMEAGNVDQMDYLDDDGRTRRTGTIWTASSHIITAVIGSGVLSLAWAIAQLGWVAGPTAMLLFAFRRVPRFSTKWICLKMLSLCCLIVSIAAAAGSIADIIGALKVYRPFSG
ncbi:hypothetical protein PR202_gb00367 [Eleusine coracana subsp. coracana]|uniref:Amino acid transporter transmembrane domain-containing protein n=1 Tax=Eleusine coracana subsp. coracana TaxID=191504 RepID=A0AAV5DT87_ELECO|nr:hypothetical protein PR202_gb00367 [Eleusine coracana subsp. coracana]